MSTTININIPNDTDVADAEGEFDANYAFAKTEEWSDHTFLLGPVLTPESRDRQGDIVSADEIEESCHRFMMDLNTVAKGHGDEETDLNLFHEAPIIMGGADVVECYVTRQAMKVGSTTIRKGSWMLGVRVYDEEIRKAVRDGQIRGFSIEGSSQAVEG